MELRISKMVKPINVTQEQMFGHAERRSFNINDVGLSLLFGSNPITDDELKELIAKNPKIYGRFAGYIGTR